MTWQVVQADGVSTPGLMSAFLARHAAAQELLGPLPRSATDLVPVLEALRTRWPDQAPRVFTGHQPQWLLGPLFVYLKIASTLLCAKSIEQAVGASVLPTVWSHTDDSDTSEVDNVTAVNVNWDVQRYSLRATPSRRPLYVQTPPESSVAVFGAILEGLPATPCKQETADAFSAAVGNGSQSFAELFEFAIRAAFPQSSIDIVEPRRHRDSCANVVKHFIIHKDECETAWQGVDEKLSTNGWPSPFDVWNAPVFFLLNDENQRIPIHTHEGSWTADRQPVSVGALLDRVEHHPDRVIPGALLRVIVQSWVFPTAVYVGGPNELAYHAYALALFRIFDLVRPILVPRASITLIDPSLHGILRRLEIDDVLSTDYDQLRNHLPEAHDPVVNRHLDQLESATREHLAALRDHLNNIDKSFAASLTSPEANINKTLDKIRKKAERMLSNRSGTGHRQVKKLAAFLRPRGALQDRQLCAFQFLVRHGLSMMNELEPVIDVWDYRHKVILAGQGVN